LPSTDSRKTLPACGEHRGHKLDVQQWRGAEWVGSETTGGVPNVAISNCACENSTCGMYFKTTRSRGNRVENLSAPSFVMRDIRETAAVVSMLHEPLRRSLS
jgi:polygalacturonase